MSDFFDDGWEETDAADLSAAYGEPTVPSAKVPDDEDDLLSQVGPAEPTVQHSEAVPEDPEPVPAVEDTPSQDSDTGLPTPLLIGGAAAIGFVVLVGLVLGGVFLVPNLLGGGLACRSVVPGSEAVSTESGLRIFSTGTQARVCTDVVDRETFLQGEIRRGFEGARSSIPSLLEMKGPAYIVDTDTPVGVELPLPAGANPRLVDLYAWDSNINEWVFVPSQKDPGQGIITADAVIGNVVVFETRRFTPLIATSLEAGESLDEDTAAALNMLLLPGLTLRADGAIEGELTAGWELDAGYAVLPVVEADGAATGAIINDPDAARLHNGDLIGIMRDGGYNGIALNYQGVTAADREAFSAFVEQLGTAFEAENRLLVMMLPPTSEGDGYDWATVGRSAGAVAVDIGLDPSLYSIDGPAYQALAYAVDHVPRQKVFFVTNASSAVVDGSTVEPMSFDTAVEPLGEVEVSGSLPETVLPGTELAFYLAGEAEDLAPDQTTGAYTYSSGDAETWIVTANTVRARLDMALSYHIGGVMVDDLLAEGRDEGLVTAINEFKSSSVSSLPSQLLFQWTVTSEDGSAVVSETTGVGSPFFWQADDPGNYTIIGELIGGRTIDRGSVTVSIAADEEETEDEEEAPVVTDNQQPAQETPTATPPPESAAPPPAGGGGGDGGGFELGGQVPNALVHIDRMQQAGMNWMKFQIKWSPGLDPGIAAIYTNAGRSAGFKVLLSIPGPLYPDSIDYASYTEFLGAVAAYQPDAIEVWNEMNIDREWPAGQISPTDYVNNMLAPGFNAIKSVSPNTMVIIGALAPTGFDNDVNAWSDQRYVQGLAAAGAANYANCIGVHHNSGTTSPYVRSGRPEGDHYSWYFEPTLEIYYFGLGGVLPVCITELGYLSPQGYGTLPANFAWAADNTVAEHAQWLGEAKTLSRNLGWVRMMIVFNVGFTTWTGDDPQAGYSVVRPDGTCPACAALADG
ncbi:MAG: hypothetical protein ACFB51_20520 [Anaerolineae bacterium]